MATTNNLGLATMNCNLEGLTNPKLIEATQNIFDSYAAIDTSIGALAYSMRKAQLLFTGLSKGEKLDGYSSFAQYATKRIGVKDSQAFNLARAGASIRAMRDSNGILRFVDVWTLRKLGFRKDFKPKDDETYDLPENLQTFSNTALVRFAEYVGKDEDAAKVKRLDDLIAKGKISPDMSVAAMGKILNPPQIKTKATDVDDSDGDDSDGDDSNQLEPKTEADRQQEKTVTVVMSLNTWNELKVEMLRYTASEPEGHPAMVAFLKMMQEKEGV